MNSLGNSPLFSHGVGLFVVIAALIVFVVMLVPMIFYILTLQKAINKCAPENQAMQPAMAWLMLVPCFNLIWHFFVVLNMAKTLGAEFQKRGQAEDPEPGKKLGLIMCILACCGFIPLLGGLCGLGYLICWILYWLKIAEFSRKLGV
jgi:predicted membrane channel-forming protein YqfA (hemolysin III family)